MATTYKEGGGELDRPNQQENTQSDVNIYGDEEINDSPIEQVRLTVPITDDPSQAALTFRTWVLGLSSCILLAFVNQFFGYRQNQLYIGSVSAQIVVLPLGKLMAATFPTKSFRVWFTNWSFSMNPGPFTLKEHVLITIFASCGANGVYAVNIITIVKAFYHRNLHPFAAMLLVQTTQMLGYGWAGVFRKYLVDSPYMWWPSNLVQVSLFRALHEEEKRPKGGRTRLQFFFLVFVTSFSYYIVPGYLFPSITSLSFVCWIWKDSITAQQIGSGLHGLGVGSFALDWSTVAGFLGSPLASPGFAIINVLIGFFLFVYIIIPIAYWSDAFSARKFPFFSSHTFDVTGQTYNISRILNDKTFDLDQVAYDGYSKLYLSIFFAFTYGLSFATLTATISHVALFNGRTIWEMWRKTTTTAGDKLGDVHTRLMKKNYEAVPQWWFYAILAAMMALSFFGCEGFNRQLQLPWWGLLLACSIALFFTLPIGIITATTNMQPGLNVITELVIGYLYPGKPLANVAFKTYGYISMSQAVMFLADFKLGHYMKIPPKSMFIVQLSIEAQKLEGVMELICHAGLEKTVTKFGPYYPMLVKECIVNLHTPFFSPDHEEYRTIFIRGRSFDFSVSSINSYLGVSEVPQVKAVALNTVAKELTDGRRKTWPIKGTLPSADLSIKYAVLLRVGLANWAPTTHSSSVSKELALLIYQIGTRSPLNFANFVLAHLEKHAKSCSPNLQIGFPSLITGMIMDQCSDIVKTNEEEGARKGSLIISEKLFKGKHASESQKPSPAKTSFVQATTVQGETIQEIEMELLVLDNTIEVLAGRRLVLDNLLAKLKATTSAAPSASRPNEEEAAAEAEDHEVEEGNNQEAESERSADF